jgi:plastocyanin
MMKNPLFLTVIALLVIGGGVVLAMNLRAPEPSTDIFATPMNTVTQDDTAIMEGSDTNAIPGEAMEDTSITVGEDEFMSEDMNVQVTVEGANFRFNPSVIRVKKGAEVEVTFMNNEGMHDFVLDEFDVKTAQVQEGESETVTFTADQAGEFEYYCSVGTHRQMGMVGTLIVEE